MNFALNFYLPENNPKIYKANVEHVINLTLSRNCKENHRSLDNQNDRNRKNDKNDTIHDRKLKCEMFIVKINKILLQPHQAGQGLTAHSIKFRLLDAYKF